MPSPTTEWVIDPIHSTISFKVKHLVIATVTGFFRTFEGTLHQSGESFDQARVAFSLEVGSLDTAHSMRDDHLKGPDFFDAATHSHISFQSTAFTQTDAENYQLTGNLTIKDVTQPITLAVVYGGTTEFRGITRAGFELTGKLSRQAFGLALNIVSDTGTLVVGDEIKLLLDVELIKQ